MFLTKDPAKPSLDNPTRLNPYNFCGNNPVNNVDPDGRLWWLIGAAIASWDWKRGHFKDFSKGQTWLDMGLGAIGGEIFGSSLSNNGFLSIGRKDDLLTSMWKGGLRSGLTNWGIESSIGKVNNFEDSWNSFSRGFQTGATVGALNWGYQKLVGFPSTLNPGGSQVDRLPDVDPSAYEGANTIGFPTLEKDAPSWFKEGGQLSKFLNGVPGFNSGAAMHDCLEKYVSWVRPFGINIGTVGSAIGGFTYNYASLYDPYHFYQYINQDEH